MVPLRFAMPFSHAARALRIDWWSLRWLVQKGELTGGRDQWGRPVVDRREVAKLARARDIDPRLLVGAK